MVSLLAVDFTQSAISPWRGGVVLPSAISRRSSEQSCSTVVRKCWTHRTSDSSSCGTGSWHQHRLVVADIVADIPTLSHVDKQRPYQSTGRMEGAELPREGGFCGESPSVGWVSGANVSPLATGGVTDWGGSAIVSTDVWASRSRPDSGS